MVKLNKGDWLLTIVYLLVNIGAFVVYHFELLDRDFIKKYYFVIGLLFFFLVFDVYNKRFRKTIMLIVWGVIGTIQLVLYYQYKDFPEFSTANGNCIKWLKAMPITVLVIFVFNYINRKLYDDYFIMTTMRITGKHGDIDERELRPMDYLFSVIGTILILIFVIL